MKRCVSTAGALSIALVALLILAACSKKSEPVSASRAPASSTAPAQTAPAPAAAAPDAAPAVEKPADTPPPEPVSETEDGDVATPGETPPGTQPLLKLGGTSAAPATPQFREGTNYVKVVPAQPTSVAPGQIEVLELFWYSSPESFALEPALDAWRGKKAHYVDLVRVPAMWDGATRLQARLFYTSELLGKLDEVHGLIFRDVNTNTNPFNSVEQIGKFFRDHGIGTDDFQKAWTSYAVDSKLQRADFLNRRYRIDSVPVIVINGRYRTSVQMAGGETQLFQLIDELAAAEHGG